MILEFKDLRVECILGMLPHEREIEQQVVVDVELTLARPPASDQEPGVDTRDVRRIVHDVLLAGKFRLQETAVQEMATRLIDLGDVKSVWVRTRKPSAFPDGIVGCQFRLEAGPASPPE